MVALMHGIEQEGWEGLYWDDFIAEFGLAEYIQVRYIEWKPLDGGGNNDGEVMSSLSRGNSSSEAQGRDGA